MGKIKIQFFHDVICSFCYPMSYRMRKLQEMMPDVDIIHRSFALVKKETDFTRMFGSRERAKNEILTHWHHANANDNLHRFNIEGMRKAAFLFPLSMKPLWACQAAYYAGGGAAYWDLFDALQTSLFTKNQNIESDKVIFENVKQTGLDFEQWRKYFLSDEVKAAVEGDFELAEKYGLQEVPAIIINDEYIVKGAVSLETIQKVIENIRHEFNEILSANQTCSLDGCN